MCLVVIQAREAPPPETAKLTVSGGAITPKSMVLQEIGGAAPPELIIFQKKGGE